MAIITSILFATLEGNIKFRTLSRANTVIEGDIEKNPSHTSIRNWTLKIGYYELNRTKEKSTDWIILLDHSIQFGREKILVILGIREHEFLKLNRPLKYTDLTTLVTVSKNNWNGYLVSEEIEKLSLQIGSIRYAVGDYGSDLKKGLPLQGIPHIHDLSHMIALITEKLYKKDNRFIELKRKMSRMRAKFIQTDLAVVVPPKGRKKSEYQSHGKMIVWTEMALSLVDGSLKSVSKIDTLKEFFETETLDRIKEELKWVNDYSGLIKELSEINSIIKEIEKEMKNNGLSVNSFEKSKVILTKCESGKTKEFKQVLISKIAQQIELLPNTDKILFSSDILESVFGKYKNRVSDNPMASVSVLMLIIAAFTVNLTEEKIRKSIETVKTKDITKWSEENVAVSLFQKRKLLFAA